MANLPKIEGVFPSAQILESKDEIIDEQINVLAFAELEGSEGKFAVVCFNIERDKSEQLYSTGFNKIILSRLKKASETNKDETTSNDQEVWFKEAINVVVRAVPSKKNPKRKYFELENVG